MYLLTLKSRKEAGNFENAITSQKHILVFTISGLHTICFGLGLCTGNYESRAAFPHFALDSDDS